VIAVPTALVFANTLFHDIGAFFQPLFRLIGEILAFIYGIFPSYAGSIALLTILIMLVLTPLTVKSTKSMIAMQRLQPEIKKLQQKYKGAENRQQLNEEMMRLYKENGVNPAGGCLPMLLQMPFLIILYDVIRGLANTIPRGAVYPTGTVLASGALSKPGQKCTEAICAVPRYIPTSSKMYHNLVDHAGQMMSFGINLALKPFSHHSSIAAYIPYFAFVVIAVVLQYIQLRQMNSRNPQAAQANRQVQTMQKVMPIIFAYIYFIIPAAVVIYMIVSTMIRIVTQDIMFRTGIIQPVGAREIKGSEKRPPKRFSMGALSGLTGGRGPGEQRANGTGGGAKEGPEEPGAAPPTAAKAPAARPAKGAPPRPRPPAKGTGTSAGARGVKTEPQTNGSTAKPHPRSKAKRTRKAR
jgi:YidC/Oxa1 family membrane protein insertase